MLGGALGGSGAVRSGERRRGGADGTSVYVTGLRLTNAKNGDFYTIAYRA